ncbi:pilus assembly protein [Shewanella sp. KT0246]|uniref:pilus assembly protein n=1 Tax=Shewanella sp. KT0246 TaxID=2815912 RepID=UPI001BB9D107|nr:PilC/PilY family type IV pilus protein [Shewanella sp. KT0246]GIU51631.1 type IV pili system adhesin PilY [Shewanella sp. KT0246]
MYYKFITGVISALIVFSSFSFADDTELYLIDSSARSGKRPQVLFIFDNSGSMGTEDQESVSPYCSAENKALGACSYASGFDDYLAGYSGYINDKGIYWNAGGIDDGASLPTPDSPNDSRRFYADNNNCNKAAEALEERGKYTGYLREFKSTGNTGSWTSLAENEGFNQGQIVDCFQDIVEYDAANPGREKHGNTYTNFDAGYPIDTKLMYTDGADSAARDESYNGTDFGTGVPVTLYSSHYLVWYEWVTTTDEGQNSGGTGSRMDVAKDALEAALVDMSIPIDAGLAIFNVNYPNEGDADGGRIVSDIVEMDSVNQASLITLVNTLDPQTNTPLCETLYEAHQYFSGGAVTFGNKDSAGQGQSKLDWYTPNDPPSIISSGNYTTPLKKCPDTAYIIYITDGAPTLDHSADTLITSLTGAAEEAADYSVFEFGNSKSSYLPALAAYMANNDVVKGVVDSNGVDNRQTVKLYTIGFSDGADAAAELLEEAAFRAGSPRDANGVSEGYFKASTGLSLSAAISSILNNILEINSSFTSPSIASNNFDKTETFNSAYFAMFYPGGGPRWSGNLKKLKVNSSGEIVGPGGTTTAIDSDGNIASTTCTYWNTCSAGNIDGNKVNSGGVLPHLRDTLKNRNIKTTSGSSLIDIDGSSFVGSYSQEDLDWLYGVDVDDDNNNNSTSDAREDIMGDPLHSKPLAINFGDKPNESGTENLDVRILVGTNQGLVHMFKDSDSGSDDFSVGSVQETWAFIPQELWSNIPVLRENQQTGVHSIYGMDLSPVAYTETNSSGKVNKAWAYMGMRRGGASYYALDITNPDSPSFKWSINSTTPGFEDLGQTWSEPTVTFVPGVDSPVLIFGGGMASSDGNGEAIYIVNADTGPNDSIIKTFTATAMSSVATKVAVLDSNNDGITDRIYASDVGGKVWRMDMPSADKSTWSIFEFASISSGSSPDDRMFFSEPTVAQTQFNNIHSTSGVLSYQNIPYDAVAIGTGNRTNPLGETTNDMFYVFQDRNVVTKTFSATDAPASLGLSDLYDVTSDSPTTETENISFGTKRGWYYDFVSTGEKSLSSSLIFDGNVYFTSFLPPSDQEIDLGAGVCDFSGQGRLYVLGLHKGTRTYSELYYELGERVPDTPQIVIPSPEEGEEAIAYIIGVGKGECENGECKGTATLGSGLSTNRIYYHIEE